MSFRGKEYFLVKNFVNIQRFFAQNINILKNFLGLFEKVTK